MSGPKKAKSLKEPLECYFDPKNASEGKCSGEVDHCFGCDKNICEGHDRNVELPLGGHRPEDHLEE